jgi:hypothetical protein
MDLRLRSERANLPHWPDRSLSIVQRGLDGASPFLLFRNRRNLLVIE